MSPKSVPNLNDVEDVEVDDAEWDKYLAFGGDNANEEDDEDMSEMQRAAQIASDEKKRKNYATDSEMNKAPNLPGLGAKPGVRVTQTRMLLRKRLHRLWLLRRL